MELEEDLETIKERLVKYLEETKEDELIRSTKKLLKAILDLPRYKQDDPYLDVLYQSNEMETIEELKSLKGDISLEAVLNILQKESGLTKEDYEEFIESYKKDLKGR